MSNSEIEEFRKAFLNDFSKKGNDSVHPKDLERVKTDDDWLQRFLLHQENNMQNALNMLWVSLNWRKENNVNDINENTVKMDILCSGAFFPHGTDIDGCELLIFKCKRNIKGGVDQNEVRRCVIYWFERLERQTKGKKITIFFDMEGCGLSNMDMDFIKYLIGLFKEYYPYFLNLIIIFEMPWVLSAAFKIVKSWLPEKAIEKIKFVSKKDITTYVPPDQALKCWGGENDYSFSFVPEVILENGKVGGTVPSNNNKKVHFVDGSMSEVSASSVEKDVDGGALKVTPSGIITFVKDGNELVSTLELHNSDSNSHISYKLKTTSPEKFRVKPSTGCLAPGETAIVTVTLLQGFQLGGLSRDKFLVMSTHVDPSDVNNIDLSELWKNTSGRKINQHRLKCIQSGEVVKNGNPALVTGVQEGDNHNYNKLSASVAQLNSCQVELHRAIKTTQYYQIVTIFLVILLAIFISYILRINLKEISSSGYCKSEYHP
ncbi:motile sperm domain-containing protein 2-like [Anoplophora glabripennis]|uniref:motile sperm domain-containing protein 2-like n=1 Tax=Anoplophora glabripennis TaxID=217634 RepID=UPI000874D5A5|nr:motile sperm domain-containing protein 2-like [Anoplophora glabripennis]XP_018572293.1 motile sperm domain-containing protein 2-like [Anoplophora glabripennis]